MTIISSSASSGNYDGNDANDYVGGVTVVCSCISAKVEIMAPACHGQTWLDMPTHRLTLVTSAVLKCLALFASAHMRVWQYDQWSDAQDIYCVEDFPIFNNGCCLFPAGGAAVKTHGSSESLIRKRSYPDFIDSISH